MRERKERWDELSEIYIYICIYAHICIDTHTHYQREIASSWEAAVYTGGFSLVLCDEGLGGGSLKREGIYVCT